MATKQKRDRSKRSAKPTHASTRKQFVAVGLLVVGLVIALLTQPNKPELEVTVAPVVQLTELKLDFEESPKAAEPHPSVVQVHELASIELEAWIHNSPFVAAHSEAINRVLTDADGSVHVHAVYGSGNDAVALVGRQLIRQGDTLPDGRRVISVTPDGVELAR